MQTAMLHSRGLPTTPVFAAAATRTTRAIIRPATLRAKRHGDARRQLVVVAGVKEQESVRFLQLSHLF